MNESLKLPAERLIKLDPSAVCAYLSGNGWDASGNMNTPDVMLFRRGEDTLSHLIVPLNKKFVDYAHRMGDVVIAVATEKNRKAWEILDEIEDYQACGPTRLPPSYFALVRKFPLVYPQSQEHRNAASSVYMRLTKKEKLDHGEHAYLVALETLIECWENSDNCDDENDYDPADDHFSG